MYECLTHMLPLSGRPTSPIVIADMKLRKKRAYEQRIREVEHSTFTPLVFSATGGMAKQSTTFYKRLASLLAVKWDHSYSSTLSWLRCRISFSLLRSAIQSIRGARSSSGSALRSTHPVDLMNNEARIGRAWSDIWTYNSFFPLLVPCVYIFIFPNTCSTCTYLPKKKKKVSTCFDTCARRTTHA